MRTAKFLLATLIDGTQVLSEFSRLNGSGQGYAGQVFSLRKPFNAWRVVAGTHPESGEPTLVRTREMISGSRIASIKQVKPLVEDHGYDPVNFGPVEEIQKGRYGSWVAPHENTPAGAVAGVAYPIHRDEGTLRRYVLLKVAQGEQAEVRHYLDEEQVPGAPGIGGGEAQHARDEFRPADADEDDEGEW